MSSRPVPTYLVLNRFDDEFGEYHRFVDPDSCRLVYLTRDYGLTVLDTEHALETVVVPDLELETVLPLAKELSERHGGFDGIVGISEWDLLTVAQLREELGVPGWRPEFVNRFRDKPRMKELVSGAGLRAPRFLELHAASTAEEVLGQVGLPIIVKPRSGAASQGVLRVDDRERLAAVLGEIDPAGYQCEEFIEGDVLHVDGVRRDSRFHFVSASAYVNNCLEFADGTPLGSVLLDEGAERDEVVAFAGACLDALGLADGPFHLELFRSAAGELVFLEVGLRPGGAEVGFIHRDLFGVDLFAESFRAALGLPPFHSPGEFVSAPGGGWVSIPEPRPLPSRIVSRTSLVDVIDEVYDEVLPEVGSVLDGSGGYEHIGGRFRLRGEGHDAVRRAALEVMDRYRLVAEPAERPGAPS
ncbi:ATP-grasp domain-containing protein [Streptacidiphilus fuscans]|uniref:ATP-grasp domain-containing protein n=1 Tax=Streptacidiphilus fuscans TaxID=2789292 RepID=A0A931BC09_9ACTN|nr:ATP-grasp domain-containing protein [Streptacidiphilus fuscans]MBF9070650.1 ATP-grasp domain-containing protein [Streptacidiphilus fuscans]